MFDLKTYNQFVDWADTILVNWVKDHARDYKSFQDMIDDIDTVPLGFSNVNDGYIGIFESFVTIARQSPFTRSILKETLLECGNADFGLMVDRLYRDFLLHCIGSDIKGYERVWKEYHIKDNL